MLVFVRDPLFRYLMLLKCVTASGAQSDNIPTTKKIIRILKFHSFTQIYDGLRSIEAGGSVTPM